MAQLPTTIELGTHRGWRMWAYHDEFQVRAYAIGPGEEPKSEEALFARAVDVEQAAAALRRAIDAELGERTPRPGAPG